jgi:hypothetical protein
MKLHIGADSNLPIIHSMGTTAANTHDAKVLGELLHGNETRIYGDQAYRGQKQVIRAHAPKARDLINRGYRHRGVVDEVERAKNRTKSRVRAKVEHPFRVIKRVFGFVKVGYRGLAKNTQRLWVTCGWPICSWSGGRCACDTGRVPGAYQPGIKYREFRLQAPRLVRGVLRDGSALARRVTSIRRTSPNVGLFRAFLNRARLRRRQMLRLVDAASPNPLANAAKMNIRWPFRSGAEPAEARAAPAWAPPAARSPVTRSAERRPPDW